MGISLYFEILSIVTFAVSLFDDQGPYFWRIYTVIFSVILFADFAAYLVFFRDIDSLKHVYKKKGEVEVKKTAYRYLDPIHIEEEVEEVRKVLEAESESLKTLGKGIMGSIKKERQEFSFAFIIGFFLALTGYPIFYSLALVLTTKDINDEQDVYYSKLAMLFGTILNAVFVLCAAQFNLFRRRKLSYALGQLVLMLSWAGVAVSYLTGVIYISNLEFLVREGRNCVPLHRHRRHYGHCDEYILGRGVPTAHNIDLFYGTCPFLDPADVYRTLPLHERVASTPIRFPCWSHHPRKPYRPSIWALVPLRDQGPQEEPDFRETQELEGILGLKAHRIQPQSRGRVYQRQPHQHQGR